MAEALISVLLEQLASVVYEHTKEAVKLVLNAEEDVKNFSRTLEAIQAVLEDAEKKQVTSASVANWLEKLKDVSYEMVDVLDEWSTELLKHQEDGKVRFPNASGCFCFGQVNKVIQNRSIAKRIKKLNDKLTLIDAERGKYDFQHSTVSGCDDQQLILREKTSSLVDISKIYGRDEEKEGLLRKLMRDSSQKGGRFLVIPIVGMGGMGKTTFAQLAYNNEGVQAHFDNKVWVCVSDPFDEIKIAKAIVENLDKNEPQRSSNELETLLRCIKSHVRDKRFLLVLDDVWTENPRKWESLKLPEIVQTCAEGSTILVTTRKEGVARMMRATSNMIHLDKLNDMDSLALFNSITFSGREEAQSSEFGAIGVEIVKKCKGLPLAIKTLGSLLWFRKTVAEWRDVLKSKIWELEEFEEQVFKPLLLSYYDLTSALRRCLLYCVTFPKDYELRKDQLIELWMSQDYLTLKESKNKRKLGQFYFESLAMRSFFQDFNKDELGNVCSCKMHDIVHDFVQFLSKRECITIDRVEGASQQMEVEANKVRHLTLTSVPDGPLSFPTSFYPKMRSLTIVDSKITAINSATILQMKCLRTLNLRGSKLEELPNEIGELVHLRYMDLSYSEALKVLPEAVCDLYNLQTLDVRGCEKLTELPKGMGKLINLKHLYVRGCRRLRYLPKGIGSLKSLQVLDYFIVSADDEALKLGDLGSMDLQGSLRIIGLGNKDDASAIEKAQLGNKDHLSQLVVEFKGYGEGYSEILKALRPHQNLESLFIFEYEGTTESLYWIFNSSFQNLRRVSLYAWKYCQFLPPLGKLPSLEVLQIRFMEKVKKVGVEFLERQQGIVFPKLKQLSFEYMWNWEEWEGITEDSSEITIMPHLSSLKIDQCPKLKALPDFLFKITELRTLEIYGCSILREKCKEGVGKEWHNISHIPNVIIGYGN